MRTASLLFAAIALCVSASGTAAEPVPEITRTKPFDPQARGVVHALRVIPEACVRLQGRFDADGAASYSVQPARSAPTCQPRARFVDATRLVPSQQGGWVLNDRIRIASAECPTQTATIAIWRKPTGIRPLALDAQGRARIYLDEARQQEADDALAKLALYAAQVDVQGSACGR